MIIVNYPPSDTNSDTWNDSTTLPEHYGYVITVDADIEQLPTVLKTVKKEHYYVKFKNNFSKMKKYQKL